jgi:hypothetical protein
MATDQQQGTVTVRKFEGVAATEAVDAPVTIPPVARKSLNDMGALPRTLIPLAVVVASVLVFSQLVALWPAVLNATPDISRAGAGANAVITTPQAMESSMLFGIWTPSLEPEVAVLLMVVMTGLLGALIGTGRKYQRWAHRDLLTKRDEWSYALLPLQGAMLAVVVYFTFRGGFLGTDATAPLNPYGIAAVAGIVGLFTDNAMHKLRQIMDTLFGRPTQPAVEGDEDGGGGGGGKNGAAQ